MSNHDVTFSLSKNAAFREPFLIDKLASVPVFKVVIQQLDAHGITTIIDVKDGSIYYAGNSHNRVSNNVSMYNTKTAALRDTHGAFLKVDTLL
jgi:hypothetical protein